MQVLKNGKMVQFSRLVKYYRDEFRKNSLVKLITDDHISVLSAYIAWMECKGSLAIISPLMPQTQLKLLEDQISKAELDQNILFHTSGTTGTPKLVIRDKEFMTNNSENSKSLFGFDKDTGFANILPAPTAGFVHMIVSALYSTDSTLILSNRSNLKEDLSDPRSTLTVLVPAVVNMLKQQKADLPFKELERVVVGGSPFLDFQCKYLFDRGANKICHAYGSTENGAPILTRTTTYYDDTSTWLEINDKCLFKQGELIYNGNYTGDVFEQKHNLIKFVGRNNDIIKMNGYMTNLFNIETEVEALYPNVEALVSVESKMGRDYLLLRYAGGDDINLKKLQEVLKDRLPPCNIPAKCLKVDKIPRNILNKKIRHENSF